MAKLQPLVVLTGASRGLGLGIAKELGKLGAFVVGTGRSEASVDLSNAGDFLPGRFHYIRGDICDPRTSEEIARFVEQQSASAQLVAIVNNAGYSF